MAIGQGLEDSEWGRKNLWTGYGRAMERGSVRLRGCKSAIQEAVIIRRCRLAFASTHMRLHRLLRN